jgi:FixJ family two-component response regulator
MAGNGDVLTVVVIEDDDDVRESLDGLFRSVGLRVQAYSSVHDFMESGHRPRPRCMVLDVRLPGKSGLEFQEDIVGTANECPIVFISGHADVAMSVRAMKAGAVEFLTKPVRDQELLEAVHIALEQDRARQAADHDLKRWKDGYALLTPRERDIMARVVTGRRNKEIAADVGISEATVKLHRASIMQKTSSNSVVDLVRLNDALNKNSKL